jgi:hydroxymethylglutaryl-CoA lyase
LLNDLKKKEAAMAAETKVEVLIEEDAPRDGIQNEPQSFSVEDRIELVDALSACGFYRIQVGAFVSPQWVPQMADTERVFEGIERYPGVTYSALILNKKGLDRAFGAHVNHVSIFVSAGETHSRKNANCSVEEATRAACRLISQAKAGGLAVQAGVMNAFGCHFDGEIPPQTVLKLIEVYVESGADEVNLADTAGLAHPRQIEVMVDRVRDVCEVPVALHLHDSYGFGLANVFSAWKSGVTRFDACCGGLGGCPFIPGAAGNVATEDVVHLFHAMGVPTRISLRRLTKVVCELEKKMGRHLRGRYTRTCGMN